MKIEFLSRECASACQGKRKKEPNESGTVGASPGFSTDSMLSGILKLRCDSRRVIIAKIPSVVGEWP